MSVLERGLTNNRKWELDNEPWVKENLKTIRDLSEENLSQIKGVCIDQI